MSKMTPLGQSMAALFTPESSKLRKELKEAKDPSGVRAPTFKIPGIDPTTTVKGEKAGDSLGNPNTPGYEYFGKKEDPSQETANPLTQKEPRTRIENVGSQFIRLGVGWEKILLAQKKICEKAKGLFTSLEAPEKYNHQKRGKALLLKSRGCIVDLDIESHRQDLEHKKKLADKEDKEDKEAA